MRPNFNFFTRLPRISRLFSLLISAGLTPLWHSEIGCLNCQRISLTKRFFRNNDNTIIELCSTIGLAWLINMRELFCAFKRIATYHTIYIYVWMTGYPPGENHSIIPTYQSLNDFFDIVFNGTKCLIHAATANDGQTDGRTDRQTGLNGLPITHKPKVWLNFAGPKMKRKRYWIRSL